MARRNEQEPITQSSEAIGIDEKEVKKHTRWERLLATNLEALSVQFDGLNIQLLSRMSDHQTQWLQRTGLDFAFMQNDTSLCLVGADNIVAFELSDPNGDLSHPKRTKLSSGHIIGVIIPRECETDAELYKRAQNATAATIHSLGWKDLLSADNDFKPKVAIASREQFGLWSTGNPLHLRPYYQVDGSEPSYEKELLSDCVLLIERQLQALGLSDTVRVDVCLPRNGELEIIFQPAHTKNDVSSSYFGLPFSIVGLNAKDNTEMVQRVVGLKMFDEHVDPTERFEVMRAQKYERRSRTQSYEFLLDAVVTATRPKVLSVNRHLLEIWSDMLERGEQFMTPLLTEFPNRDLVRDDESGFHGMSSVQKVELVLNERGRMTIGALPGLRIRVTHQDGRVEQVLLDFGQLFDEEDYEYSGIVQPSMREGLSAFSFLPLIPRVFRLHLLLATAKVQGRHFLRLPDPLDPEDDLHSFTLLDLFVRLKSTEFRTLCFELDTSLQESDYEEIVACLNHAKKDKKSFDTIRTIALLITHFHMDHIGFAALVSDNVPHAFLAESDPIAHYLMVRSGSWIKEIINRRGRAKPILDDDVEAKEGSYSPPLHAMMPYETRFIGRGNISVTALPCDHSMYGSTMYLVVVYDELMNPVHTILYTGDFRFNDTGLTEKTREVLSQISIDTVITESTNIATGKGKSPKKGSQKVTKERMNDEYERIFKKEARNKPVIVMVDPKDMQLVQFIARKAMDAGRVVLLSEAHALLSMSYQQFDAEHGYSIADLDAQTRTRDQFGIKGGILDEEVDLKEYHPRLRMGQQQNSFVGFSPSGKESLKQLERKLYFYHGGVAHHLSELESNGTFHGQPVVVFASPHRSLKHQFGLRINVFPNAHVLIAHFFPYATEAKKQLGADEEFCRRNGWTLHSDYSTNGNKIETAQNPGLRRSGHATEEQVIGLLAGILAKNPNAKIVPVHGKHRFAVNDAIREGLERHGINRKSVDVIPRIEKRECIIKLNLL